MDAPKRSDSDSVMKDEIITVRSRHTRPSFSIACSASGVLPNIPSSVAPVMTTSAAAKKATGYLTSRKKRTPHSPDTRRHAWLQGVGGAQRRREFDEKLAH